MKVRMQLDFTVDCEEGALPAPNILDLIENGIAPLGFARAILPGASIRITAVRATPPPKKPKRWATQRKQRQ